MMCADSRIVKGFGMIELPKLLNQMPADLVLMLVARLAVELDEMGLLTDQERQQVRSEIDTYYALERKIRDEPAA